MNGHVIKRFLDMHHLLCNNSCITFVSYKSEVKNMPPKAKISKEMILDTVLTLQDRQDLML